MERQSGFEEEDEGGSGCDLCVPASLEHHGEGMYGGRELRINDLRSVALLLFCTVLYVVIE